MHRFAPFLIALGLACFLGQLIGDGAAKAEAGEVGMPVMVLLAFALFAVLIGGATLVRRQP